LQQSPKYSLLSQIQPSIHGLLRGSATGRAKLSATNFRRFVERYRLTALQAAKGGARAEFGFGCY
jgi:hypothetical protein